MTLTIARAKESVPQDMREEVCEERKGEEYRMITADEVRRQKGAFSEILMTGRMIRTLADATLAASGDAITMHGKS